MSRLWAVLVGVLATLTMAGVAPTTTASAAPFVYDAPALARVDAHASGLTEAGQRAPIGAQEGSVLPWVEARGTATTFLTRSIATEAAGAAEGGGLQIAEGNAGHIFRDAAGHLAEDRAANRAIIQSAADNGVLVRTSPQGVQTFRQLLPDGTEAWAEVYQGQVSNGGVNVTPRSP